MSDVSTPDSSALAAPEVPGGKPLRRDAQRNRQLILQAGRELFAERGLAVSLDDIAARAGVGVGTVYRRFPHRDALVDALFHDRIDELVANAERALALDDPWQSIVQLLEGYMELQAGDRSFGPVVLTDAHGRGALDCARDKIKPVVGQIVERAQRAGVVRKDLTATDVPMLILMVSTLQNAARDVAPEVWRRYLQVVLDGLRPPQDSSAVMREAPVDPDDVPRVMHAAYARPGR
ncbi:MAG: TetR/AcrR family transcriptional regulator [Solirubrobacteraceae bacterium]|nr:TetR/AcrR family transcriptional regulator [Solirubrobacteraceae bacterium]